jgi:FMN phosphatase YigB (HAD superfamily)
MAVRLKDHQREQLGKIQGVLADVAGVLGPRMKELEGAPGELSMKALIRDHTLILISSKSGLTAEVLEKEGHNEVFTRLDPEYYPVALKAFFQIPMDVFFEEVYGPLEGTIRQRARAHRNERLIKAVRDFDLPIGALSNRPMRHFNDPMLDELELLMKINPRIGLERMGRNKKPDEVVYRIGIEAMGLPASAILYVDDKPRNLVVPDGLGMPTALIGSDYKVSASRVTNFRFDSFEIMLETISSVRRDLKDGKEKTKTDPFSREY